MTGFDILKVRKQTGVSQSELARALKLRGGRGSLTDIENGCVEVTPAWALTAIATIEQIAKGRTTAREAA